MKERIIRIKERRGRREDYLRRRKIMEERERMEREREKMEGKASQVEKKGVPKEGPIATVTMAKAMAVATVVGGALDGGGAKKDD